MNGSGATVYETTGGGTALVNTGNTVVTVASGAATGLSSTYAALLTEQQVCDVDAIDVAVLDRDAGSADLVSAQMVLANGGGMNDVMSAIAHSAEAEADMTSTYAAVGDASQLEAQPQLNLQLQNTDGVDAQDTVAPTSREFAGFADAMSTSYGAPVELVSIDPYNDQQTELAVRWSQNSDRRLS